MAVCYQYIILRFTALRLIFGLKGKADSPGHAVPVVHRFLPLRLKEDSWKNLALQDFHKQAIYQD
tara:strand:+ start:1331 stop:1525 length:195 start_codon:yes stop_codon:yes gene_type:complete